MAEALDSCLPKKHGIAVVLALEVSEDELVKRLFLNRGLLPAAATDIDENIIRTRYAEYQKKTSAVADYYRTTTR